MKITCGEIDDFEKNHFDADVCHIYVNFLRLWNSSSEFSACSLASYRILV